MKKLIFILFITIFTIHVFSQRKYKPEVSFYHNTFLFGSYWTFSKGLPSYSYAQRLYMTGVLCQRMDFDGGINLIYGNYSLGIKLSYQYFVARGFIIKENAESSQKGLMRSQLIGLNIKNRFRDGRITCPYFSIAFSTEMQTNYRNRYLWKVDYFPFFYKFDNFSPGSIKLNIYHSTPFVGDLLAGCDFRIYKGFSANIGVGYGLRVLRVQYANVTFPAGQQPSTPIKVEKIGDLYSLPLNYFVIQAGLSYAFDVHKKKHPKTATP